MLMHSSIFDTIFFFLFYHDIRAGETSEASRLSELVIHYIPCLCKAKKRRTLSRRTHFPVGLPSLFAVQPSVVWRVMSSLLPQSLP